MGNKFGKILVKKKNVKSINRNINYEKNLYSF